MKDDPFKVRVSDHRPKQPLVLTQSQLNQLIVHSKSGQEVKAAEQTLLEERRRRQEATKALSEQVTGKREPGSEVKKRQYAVALQSAHQELARDSRIEARRNQVLDLAYRRMYEATDRVKHFRESRNLAEMLQQRDLQLEAKSSMKDLFRQLDKKFVLGMFRDVERHAEEEADKLKVARRDKLKNADNWDEQRKQVEEKKREAEWQHIRDGFIVKEAAENHAENLKKAERRRQEGKEEYRSSLDRQRNEKLALLDIRGRLDEADERRAELFVEAKRDMQERHKEVKAELDRKKESKRRYVADNLRDETTALRKREEDILQKATLQAEAKHRQDCAAKEARREEALGAIQEFYEGEMERKAERAFEDRRRGFQERREILERTDDQLQAEKDRSRRWKRGEREAQHAQLHQMARRRAEREAERTEDVKDLMNHMRSLEDEEEVFQRYAQMEISECESRGIDTRPMRVGARPGIECGKGPLFEKRGLIRPRYYSSVSRGDELNHIRRDRELPDTKSRLGFLLH